jgi:hypothetical protein
VVLAILAGCSSGSQPAFAPSSRTIGPAVSALPPAYLNPRRPFHGILGSASGSGDLYVSAFLGGTILGYKSNKKGRADKKNGPPICTISGVSLPNDIAGDAKGNLIDPDGGTHNVIVFGPKCGASKGTISDPYGTPADAASVDALTGTIAVATIVQNNQNTGSVTLCTLKSGCMANLTSSSIIGGVAAVALNKAGDCWAVSENASTAALTYFQGCGGSGQAATGFENASYGGLDIDRSGNIVSIDFKNSRLYVYKGCNPACTIVGGPFTLHGESIYGHLDKAGKTYATVEHAAGQVDIYSYKPKGLTYLYSFSNGLNDSLDYEGVAYAPSATK